MPRHPPSPTLFPYTTLFRSQTEIIDTDELLAEYTGRESGAMADSFDPTPEQINAATLVEELPLGNDQVLKVALLNKPTRGDRVQAQLALRFGTAQELTGLRTIGSATAQLLDRGIERLNRQEIMDTFNELQANVSFSGAANGVDVHISTVKEHFEDTVALVAEMLSTPPFTVRELEKYKA